MKNWLIPPKDLSVAKYIDCYWLIDKTHNDSGPEYPKLNPDPAGHLILSTPRQAYQYENECGGASGHGCHLILPHCKTISMDHSQPFLILGIKFQVGALYAIKYPTAHPLLDQVISVDVETLFQLDRFNEDEILNYNTGQSHVFRDLIDTLLTPFFSKIHEDRHSELVRKVLAIFSRVSLSEMGAELGCSRRTIERSFLRVTGLTLKQYSSMERLEAMLAYVYRQDPRKIAWADIAFQFGFSDQPHVTPYLKSRIGHTPGEYAQQRDLAIDAYGNFE